MARILYHTTLRRNLRSILRVGLDPARSTGKLPAVWLHTAGRLEWALLHTLAKHRCRLEDVVVLEVRLPERSLRRKWRGIWYTFDAVTPMQISVRDLVLSSDEPRGTRLA